MLVTIRISVLWHMFVLTEAQAIPIRTTYEQGNEVLVAVELRRLFPAITDTAQARECVRTIASWIALWRRNSTKQPPANPERFNTESPG